MEEKDRLAQMMHLRSQVAANARLQLELQAAVSKLLRDHNINIEGEVLRHLTIADEHELGLSLRRPGSVPRVKAPKKSP